MWGKTKRKEVQHLLWYCIEDCISISPVLMRYPLYTRQTKMLWKQTRESEIRQDAMFLWSHTIYIKKKKQKNKTVFYATTEVKSLVAWERTVLLKGLHFWILPTFCLPYYIKVRNTVMSEFYIPIHDVKWPTLCNWFDFHLEHAFIKCIILVLSVQFIVIPKIKYSFITEVRWI